MTRPDSTFSENFSLTRPSSSCTSASAARAASVVRPSRSGTGYFSTPRDSTSVTVSPGSTRSPGPGVLVTTWFLSTDSL